MATNDLTYSTIMDENREPVSNRSPPHLKIQEAGERQRGGNISIRIRVLILCGHTGSHITHSLYNCMINNDSVCIVKYIAYANTRLLHFSHINYHQDENAVSGEMILLGNKKNMAASPIYWKAGVIRKVCLSPKAAETSEYTLYPLNYVPY